MTGRLLFDPGRIQVHAPGGQKKAACHAKGKRPGFFCPIRRESSDHADAVPSLICAQSRPVRVNPDSPCFCSAAEKASLNESMILSFPGAAQAFRLL